MQSIQFSSITPLYPSIDFDEQEHGRRIALAKQIIACIDVAIAARAYSNALDARYGSAVYDSSVREDARALLQSFVDGRTLLELSTSYLQEKLSEFQQDAKREARYAKRLHLWTRIFEIIFGKDNFKSGMNASTEGLPRVDFGPMLLGVSLALATILVVKAF